MFGTRDDLETKWDQTPNSLSFRGSGALAKQIKRNENVKHFSEKAVSGSPEKWQEGASSWDFISEVCRLKPFANSYPFKCMASRLPILPPRCPSISDFPSPYLCLFAEFPETSKTRVQRSTLGNPWVRPWLVVRDEVPNLTILRDRCLQLGPALLLWDLWPGKSCSALCLTWLIHKMNDDNNYFASLIRLCKD